MVGSTTSVISVSDLPKANLRIGQWETERGAKNIHLYKAEDWANVYSEGNLLKVRATAV